MGVRRVGEAELVTDCDWLALHIDALFTCDARGRLLARREPGLPPAPRFYLGRTRHGNSWRIRADEPSESVRRLSRLTGREAALPAGSVRPPPPERIEALRRVLRERAGIGCEWRGPVYRFRALASRRGVWQQRAQGTRAIDPADGSAVALLRADFPAVADVLEECGPCMAVIGAGRVRAVCHSACGRSAVAREAAVETLEADRGRGLAGRCVAAWALAVADRGATPLYSTSWQNRASRAVARKLGLVPYGEDLHFG